MRLRPRRAAPVPAPEVRSVPDGWRSPRRSGRGTTIGTLEGARRALVDPAGLVTLGGASWSLDWWVGAEDRWHLPAEEVAVRQRLQSSAPVVETRLRVPSGDAVHRAYAARTLAGDDVVVVEVQNDSKVPFAVALAVRPLTDAGRGHLGSIGLDGPRIEADGEVAVVLPKSPGRMALSTAADGDAADVVLAGEAEPVRLARVACPEGLAHGAFLFPLAHTATLRVVLPLRPGAVVDPSQAPGPGDVASGWSRQVARGARVELPDRRLRDAVAASARHLLLAPPSAAVAQGLDLLGFADEAERALGEALDDPVGSPGPTLHALALHWDLTRSSATAGADPSLVGVLVARLGAATDVPERAQAHRSWPGVARLLDGLGQPRAAADVRALHRAASPPTDSGPDLAELLRDATGTWTWRGPHGPHDPAVNARLVELVRRLLVDDDADGVLALSPKVPDPWLGQGWEVHDLPTRHGRLSYAVRWHGDRPALLWQLDPHPGDPPADLTCPGLDPTWATTEPAGEALLAAVALPEQAPRRGLTLPVTIEPLHRSPS